MHNSSNCVDVPKCELEATHVRKVWWRRIPLFWELADCGARPGEAEESESGRILDHQIVGKILDHQVVGKILNTSNIAAVKVSQNYVVRLQMITDSATFESAVGTIALSITVQNFVLQ